VILQVIQVKCPKCNTAITMKQRDKLFLCDKCNTLHTRDEGIEIVPYEIAEFHPSMHGNDIYVPFWKMNCNFVIRGKQVEGGALSRLAAWAKGGSNQGVVTIFIPASDMDPATFRKYVTLFLTNPPKYTTRFNFGGVKNLPAVTSKKEAIELADFAVVTMEAEQPGTLQSLDYVLTVNDAKVVYLPFLAAPAGLTPAL